MEKKVWYKEGTYRFTMIATCVLWVVFQGGTWIVDQQIADFGASILFGGMMVVITAMSYLFRNNP